MKAVLTFLAIIILWLNAIAGDSISMKQKGPLNQKTTVVRNSNIICTDSISDYSINVNGALNSVQINSDNPSVNSLAVDPKGKKNSVEINGEGNSVKVHQSKNGGKVNIQQNGNGNQISISQTNQNTVN
ncbi:MAG TPA: hypothetical protein VIK55_02470 [Paludibacter sp.]